MQRPEASGPTLTAAETGPVVCTGSSIMAQWTDVARAFPGKHVLNTAIGGTQTHEILAMLDVLVISHAPSLVCYYCGSNDINHGATPETIVANTLRTFIVLRLRLPGIRFVYLSIIKAPQKRARWHLVDAVNSALHTEAEQREGFSFVDINPVFFTATGEPWMDAYVEDQLHLTPAAYVALGAYLTPRL